MKNLCLFIFLFFSLFSSSSFAQLEGINLPIKNRVFHFEQNSSGNICIIDDNGNAGIYDSNWKIICNFKLPTEYFNEYSFNMYYFTQNRFVLKASDYIEVWDLKAKKQIFKKKQKDFLGDIFEYKEDGDFFAVQEDNKFTLYDSKGKSIKTFDGIFNMIIHEMNGKKVDNYLVMGDELYQSIIDLSTKKAIKEVSNGYFTKTPSGFIITEEVEYGVNESKFFKSVKDKEPLFNVKGYCSGQDSNYIYFSLKNNIVAYSLKDFSTQALSGVFFKESNDKYVITENFGTTYIYDKSLNLIKTLNGTFYTNKNSKIISTDYLNIYVYDSNTLNLDGKTPSNGNYPQLTGADNEVVSYYDSVGIKLTKLNSTAPFKILPGITYKNDGDYVVSNKDKKIYLYNIQTNETAEFDGYYGYPSAKKNLLFINDIEKFNIYNLSTKQLIKSVNGFMPYTLDDSLPPYFFYLDGDKTVAVKL